LEALVVILILLFFVWPFVPLFIALGAKKRLKQLEQVIHDLRSDIQQLQARNAEAPQTAAPQAAPQAASQPAPIAETRVEIPPGAAPEPVTAQTPAAPTAEPAAPPDTAPPKTPPPAPPTPRPAPPPRAPSPPPAWVLTIKEWLFGGNLVAKMGLLILFIGVSFLLKYAASRISVPIELRLTVVTLADIALLMWGWRIRIARPGISLPVQGAALSILMMVTFAAFRLYHLIPGGMAFGLLFLLTALTCILAVLQDALWLAIFGIIGGFAVPILTSTGGGSHIGLFSYYALLNSGILVIALRRSWRVLNVLGFVFTFVVGTAWGVLRYLPENYWSAQLFLILFFVFYVAIALIYASMQAPTLKNYVDATLVFGTPIIAFGLQYNLVKDMQMGATLSSLALGLFYIGLALVLWRRRADSLKLLIESFLALGVVFGTLAIPFALDGRWTSAAWALEGAGVIWVGLRQRQPLVWKFGLLVQVGAWLSFLQSAGDLDAHRAMESSLWLGFLLLAATALLMATNFRAQSIRDNAQNNAQDSAEPRTGLGRLFGFGPLATLFLALAVIWLVAGAWVEIFLRTSGSTQATLLVASALLTATGLAFLAQKMLWLAAKLFAVVVQIVAGVMLLLLTLLNLDWPQRHASADLFEGPFLGALLIGAASFFSSWVFHRQPSQTDDPDTAGKPVKLSNPGKLARPLLLWSGFWWYGQILYALSGWLLTHYLIFSGATDYYDLHWAVYGTGLALSAPVWIWLARRLAWPDLRWAAWPTWMALATTSCIILVRLYFDEPMPRIEIWASLLALWLASEYLMRVWRNTGRSTEWPMKTHWLKVLHLLRTVAPWLMIWPVGAYWIALWLHEDAQAAPSESGSWARYVPAWLMMLAVAWLIRRVRANGWPVPPLAKWYQASVIPLAAGWSIVLVAIWNISQDGAMAPLPYLPLINPLDLTTGFACLLGLAAFRLRAAPLEAAAPAEPAEPDAAIGKPGNFTQWSALPLMAALAAYAWFNLMLLRTAAHVLDIPYQFDPLFESTIVQTMLSLVWSVTALILMRFAAKTNRPKHWLLGAALLGVVVGKLFLVDQSGGIGVERIVAFVGVGLLMLVIGYLAPYPAQAKEDKQ
jgi:uncharacterized membrane protein